MRILLIEDDPHLATTLRDQLIETYVVDMVHEGAKAVTKATLTAYDLILLDLGLPDMDGVAVCTELRKNGVKTPILILTGQDDVNRRVDALDHGADDYLTKPFNFAELSARLRALSRRNPDPMQQNELIIKDLVLNPYSHTVTRSNKDINLRRREFSLLAYLMRNQGRVVTRKMILENVWEESDDAFENTINVHVKHLRDKVDRPFSSSLIQTIRGIGYRIG